MDERERAQNTPLPDDPEYWPDDTPPKYSLQDFVDDMLAAFGSAFLVVLLGVSARFTYGWVARIIYGAIVMFVAVLGMMALANHRRRR